MYKTLTIAFSLLFCSLVINGQTNFRVMSYNVENLFDVYDDPLTDDDEFLPTGNRRWTNKRYNHKLQQIAKVINAAGEWDTPALIGLCEVENDTVITHLLNRTPLRKQYYRYCITRGSDKRGINVALLYQRDKFRYIDHHSVPVKYKKSNERLTRDILHIYGEIITGDTLDVMVCHFPSKYGGEKESEARRMDAAVTLKSLCDSLINIRSYPLLIVMGDFNDPPESKCLALVTGNNLCNLFTDYRSQQPKGTQKYRDKWTQLDQIIIYNRMLNKEARMRVIPESCKNVTFPFLFKDDKTWRGKRLHRTYHGFKYEGGYSDHLPVIADFLLTLPQ